MQFFVDTANLDEIRHAIELGLIDGVTTNPSLMAKEKTDWKAVAQHICTLVPGPVSVEVMSTKAQGMVEEARELIGFGPNVVIKVPMSEEGLKATKILHSMDIDTNVTLIFSSSQALLAAKAGATYVSPFVGRLDDIGQDGIALVQQIMTIYELYGFTTKVIAASIRNTAHVLGSALAGSHIATVPYKILLQLIEHPLTHKGIEAFELDWKKRNFTI